MERNESVTQSLCIVYDGAVVEVDSLKEGLKLADEMVCENGSDITIVQNEEVIARREWIAESEVIDPFGDPMDAERDPIVFEGVGFYSDWLIDQNYKENEITNMTFSELLDSGQIRESQGSQYKTFGELLNSNQAFDCELIIGDVDMPASFVWNEESRITPYGCDYFKPLMACSYELMENGNISIADCDEVTGEKFALACAGYISTSEFNKMFSEVVLDEKAHDSTQDQRYEDLEDEWEPEM